MLKATNIKWDTDGDKKLLKQLPHEIDIPEEITDEDDIADYITDVTGFCHFGFEIEGIINATFTSVWDGGYAVTTDCKVNMKTKEVFDIKITDENADSFDVLEREFITINNQDYPVFQSSDITEEDDEWWYKA